MKREKSFAALASIGIAVFLILSSANSAMGQNRQGDGGVVRLTLKSEVLGEERTILVRTPPGYEQSAESYPVLYMTDGDAHIAHTAATVDFLARNGRIPQLIIVGITNTDRTRDLTPTNASLSVPNGRPIEFPTSGGADKFLKFIETELMLLIDSRYRTLPYKIFAGHSFGGLFALHAFLSKPELFNAYIAASPSMNWDDYFLIRRGKEFFKDRRELKKTLFFTLANEGGDTLVGFNRFKDLLSKQKLKDFEWDSMLMEDEDHGSVVMRSHYFGLRKVFDGWRIPTDSNTGGFAGGYAGVEEHYKKLSSKFGFPVAPPENLINQLGYQLLQSGKSEEAIAAFKSNVERYPNSANVYDSLAEAYEKSGRLDLARPNYEKAYNIGREKNDPNSEIYKTNLDRVVQLLDKK